jgi:hypothetical protein
LPEEFSEFVKIDGRKVKQLLEVAASWHWSPNGYAGDSFINQSLDLSDSPA